MANTGVFFLVNSMGKHELNIGIYKITNNKNGKSYIGGTSDIKQRFITHWNGVNGGYHSNHFFQADWNKYGPKNFTFNVLLYCEKDNLRFFEQRTIESYGTLNSKYGYNCFPVLPGMPRGSNYVSWMAAKKAEKMKYRKAHRKRIIPKKKIMPLSPLQIISKISPCQAYH
jgi:group I intron endonuclease